MPDGLLQGAAAQGTGDASRQGMASGASPGLFDRLSPEILGSLTARQKSAIAAAAAVPVWQAHPINIRVSLPLLPRRWYFTLVGGPERRAAARRQIDRTRHPLRTAGNVAFVFAAAVVFYGVAVAGLLFSSSILEY